MIEKLLRKDILVKVAAIVLALLMWAQVADVKNPITNKQITVDVRLEAPSGRTATLTGQDKVTVTLEGRSRALAQITPERQAALAATADLSKAVLGRTSNVPVSFTSPFAGVQVIGMTPNTVAVSLDALSEKEVAVNITTRGVPNQDFEALKPSLPLPTVTVSGPRTKLDKVQEVSGEIDVTGAVAAVTRPVPLVARDSAGNEVADVSVTPAEVEVTVPMKSLPPAKVVPVKVELVGTPKAGFRVNAEKTTVTPSSVKIRGDSSVTRSINSISTRSVDLSGRDASFTTTVSLAVPAGVTVESTSTKVTVYVEIEEDIVEKTFTDIPVVPERVPVDFTWKIDPARVTITLTGRSDLLATLKSWQAYIDASAISLPDLMQGGSFTTTLPVLLRGTDGLGINVKPAIVTLTLTKR